MTIVSGLGKSISVFEAIRDDAEMINTILAAAKAITDVFAQDRKVLFCGNGGSAADAQHLAAELSGRFYFDRDPLYAEALHVNTSYLTAVANDYSYDDIYSRLVKAKGRTGDILVGLSTSGNSSNIVNALNEARSRQMVTIGFTGAGGGKMRSLCDYLIAVPSNDTPRIQEAHITIGHLICENIEAALFGSNQ